MRTPLAALAIALSVFIALPAAAKTEVSSGNVINQTWTAAGSPYVVSGDLVVPEGSYLRIEAGVQVELKATDVQLAHFRLSHAYDGLEIEDGDVITHLHHAELSENYYAGLMVMDGDLYDDAIYSHDNSNAGIRLYDSTELTLTNAVVADNGADGLIVSGSVLTLTNATVYSNSDDGIDILDQPALRRCPR